MKKVAKTSVEKLSQMLGLLLGEHFSTPLVMVTDEYTSLVIF